VGGRGVDLGLFGGALGLFEVCVLFGRFLALWEFFERDEKNG
jgi:hypothetical protein